MKKTFKLLPLLALLPAAASELAIKPNLKVSAATDYLYANSSLPTTIDLNDYTDAQIRNYYSDLVSKPESERKGQNLLKALKPILSNNQKYYSYDISSGQAVWQMYEITDRDWAKSPASELGSKYNPSTNVITGYTYLTNKTYNASGAINPYVKSYYMDYTQENQVKAWGNHNQDGIGINREHLWPKSEGFGTESSTDKGGAGARGDPMHLVAANGWANNQHNNNFYGYVDTSKDFIDCSTKYSTVGHNLLGESKTSPTPGIKVFEPQDADKGDIARAMFYMVARYNDVAGTDTTICMDNPNLMLTNDLTKWEKSGFSSTQSKPGYMALMSDLLEWNKLDPVDEYEIHRNNILHRNFTNNRNPFIDFPEWADVIWGNDSSLVANPTSDALNDADPRTPNTISDFVIGDINYGETISPSATAIIGDVTFSYSENANGPFVSEKPLSAGTYFVRATSASNEEYKSTTQVKKFRVAGDPNTISQFVVNDVKEGKEVNPTASCEKGSVSFTYSTTEDGLFSKEKPTEPGSYYCKATSPNDGKYEGQSEIKPFKILKKTFMDSITDENGLVFGLMPQKVFYVVAIAGAVAVVTVVFLIYLKGKKKTKKKATKIIKSVAKDAGINIPKTPSNTSKTVKKTSSGSKSSGTKKSTSKSSSSKSTKK